MSQQLVSNFISRISGAANNSNSDQPESSAGLRAGAKVVGAIAGAAAILTGIFTIISLSLGCIIAGVLMMVFGALIFTIEVAPCCPDLPCIGSIATFVKRGTFLHKSITYIIIGLLPLFLCFGFASFVGCLIIIIASVMNGMLWWRGRSSGDQMAASAVATDSNQMPAHMQRSDDTKAGLIDNQEAYQYPPPQAGFH